MQHGVRVMALLGMTSMLGCSGNYRPANSPRIAMGMQGGTLTYYKDGREYPAGFFGGGTVDAVEGNPRAVAEAKKGRDLVIGGFVVSMAALGGLVTGIVVQANDDDRFDGPNTAALGLTIGSLGLSIVGAVLTASGIPYFYDAVAIYNDGVPLPVYVPPYAPQGFPPPHAPPPVQSPHAPPPVESPQKPPSVQSPEPDRPAPTTAPPPPS